ncbi:protoporphyrinogen oxidase [Rhodobacteraceae bacterium CCMM004]|nr:protoporphyrinogen oxidase [Rhodobacteraceae bacterium CCMM004]
MHVLIVYGTVEGQTRKIARSVEGQVAAAGHDATLFDAGDKTGEVDFTGVDAVILAASVHERRHPVPFEVFLSAHRDDLNARRCLMLSVSISAAFPEGLEEAQDYVDEMKLRTGLAPAAEALVAGAVRSRKYDYFAQQVIRHVVLRGREAAVAGDDAEFTDWGALERTVADFLAGAGAADAQDATAARPV